MVSSGSTRWISQIACCGGEPSRGALPSAERRRRGRTPKRRGERRWRAGTQLEQLAEELLGAATIASDTA